MSVRDQREKEDCSSLVLHRMIPFHFKKLKATETCVTEEHVGKNTPQTTDARYSGAVWWRDLHFVCTSHVSEQLEMFIMRIFITFHCPSMCSLCVGKAYPVLFSWLICEKHSLRIPFLDCNLIALRNL